MKKLFLVFLAAMLLLTSVALADFTVETVVTSTSMLNFTKRHGYYFVRSGNGYQLYDLEGNAISDVHSGLTAMNNGRYYKYYGEGINSVGLVDEDGRKICDPMYGSVTVVSDDLDWLLGYVLEATELDTGDFKDSNGNHYMAVRADVYYKGQLLGSLTRDQHSPDDYVSAVGKYLGIKRDSSNGMYIDRNFNITMANGKYSAFSEFAEEYGKGVFHYPTQTYAFRADCTLTPEDVECPVRYDEKKEALIDLQGNVVKDNLKYYDVREKNGYLLIYDDKLYGLMDMKGNIIVEPIYASIQESGNGVFLNGYQIVLTQDGYLAYVDENGQEIVKSPYKMDLSSYKGYYNNPTILAIESMGQIIIFTATHGELPTKYEDYVAVGEKQSVIAVKKDGLWGVIDMAGNIVLPFEMSNSPTISTDGTVIQGRNANRDYVIYKLTDGTAPVATEVTSVPDSWTETQVSGEDGDTTPVLAEGAWECTCGVITNGKFCPECGSKKPEPTPTPEPTPAPAADDGSWACDCGSVNTGKFCPECGNKKPEATPVPTPVPDPQCVSCGYKPEGTVPKFCPECGTKF